jgi:hypothetical protein
MPTGKTAQTPEAQKSNPEPVQPSQGTSQGVATETRVLGASGPEAATFSVPNNSEPARQAYMQRWWDEEVVLDVAAGAGVRVARHLKEMRRREVNAAKQTVNPGCQTSLDTYTLTSNQGGLKGSQVGAWVCGVDEQIKFTERNYSNQHNEFRLFIEGADVTHYVEGAISWSLEATGGMNSCRFTLNNTQDAFILTPENICAGLDPKGWRISGLSKGSVSWRVNPARDTWRVDETAKFIMYVNKYKAVDPSGTTPQVDLQTKMWLFPLNPYSCILNRHDCVRLFVRLPHVSHAYVSEKGKKPRYSDLWMPAFTGFVKDYSWDDDPVAGTRYVKVTCSDYRMILERMRVAIAGCGTQAKLLEAQKAKVDQATQALYANPNQPDQSNVVNTDTFKNYSYMAAAMKAGYDWALWIQKKLGGDQKYSPNSTFRGVEDDPFKWCAKYKLAEKMIKYYENVLAQKLVAGNAWKPRENGNQSAGGIGGQVVDLSLKGAQQAIKKADESCAGERNQRYRPGHGDGGAALAVLPDLLAGRDQWVH